MALGARSLTAEWKGLVTLLFLQQSSSDPTRPPLPSSDVQALQRLSTRAKSPSPLSPRPGRNSLEAWAKARG